MSEHGSRSNVPLDVSRSEIDNEPLQRNSMIMTGGDWSVSQPVLIRGEESLVLPENL